MRPSKNHDSYSPETKNNREDPFNRLRSTLARIEDRASDLYTLRNSYSSGSLKNISNPADTADFRMSSMPTQKKKSFQTLKSTLDLLEEKIKSAKQQLHIPASSMKKKQKNFTMIEESEILHKPTHCPSDSTLTLKNSERKINQLVSATPKPKNFKPVYLNPYSPRRHSIYYVSEAVRAMNQKNSIAMEHVSGSIRIIKACEGFQIPDLSQIEDRKVNLKKSDAYRKKKTLVLDLDETLIHCVENQYADADLKLNFHVEEQEVVVGINIRPYALSFLKKMAKKYEIIIFTASHHTYADAILDELDPEGEIFQHRLYRQHCFVLENEWHVKDLRIINRNLSEMVLVDNAAYSYSFQLQNGIPILPYYEGSDYQLAALQAYLEQVEKSPDVREVNKRTFKLHHYSKFYSSQELIEELYLNNFN